MIVDRGLNDHWVRPHHIRRTAAGQYELAVKEPLGQSWAREIVTYPFPQGAVATVQLRWNGREIPCQMDGDRLAVLLERLEPGEARTYQITLGKAGASSPTSGIAIRETPDALEVDTGLLAIRVPATQIPGTPVPGPLLAVRRGDGPWLGQGRLESPLSVTGITTSITGGSLWTTVAVRYTFEGDYTYTVRYLLQPGEAQCEVREESSLPVRLLPAPRPAREIGSLGASHWDQKREDIAKPCIRPCPTSNVIFDLRAGFTPQRLVTPSTACWEIMDLALDAPTLKAYTAMRPALPFVDGSWLGVYDSRRDELFGVVPMDICHWRIPDETIHPYHRLPGANSEVILLDGGGEGTYLRFPIENVTRRWLLAVVSRRDDRSAPQGEITDREPIRREPDPEMPLWKMRQRVDIGLEKVKDWVVDWPDAGDEHPRVLCGPADFPALREKMQSVPELKACYEKTREIRSADRYIMTGEVSGLAAIENATHGGQIVAGLMAKGYASPSYCIALARPLRRYVIACDIQWPSFTPEEKREARRVLALAAYILSDGDWWQYAFRDNETTYLPNFNTDVFTCCGLIGLFLSDHPCADAWVHFLTSRLDHELKTHLRRDGGGEENMGNYLPATWMMLYMPVLWGLRHRGVKDYSADPNILAGARFLLKVLGPPDPRDNGERMLPPIGHHPYARKDYPLYDWLATFVKDADPELAAHLKWAWREVGSTVGNFYDHSGPTADPTTQHYIYHDPTVQPAVPTLESHDLPHVGAVLRSHDTSGQGSFLILKSGRVHSHHDDDEGSIHYQARGVPLAMDGL
ncbi:MAG TPA: hypothetical protein VGM23_03160, partial [Armatimonadota bacterium]